MKDIHEGDLVADYLLGLLPESESRQVQRHIAHCSACRTEVQTQRALVLAVKTTLRGATEPNQQRLQQIREHVMPSRRGGRTGRAFQWPQWRAFAMGALLLITLVSFGLGLRYESAGYSDYSYGSAHLSLATAEIREAPRAAYRVESGSRGPLTGSRSVAELAGPGQEIVTTYLAATPAATLTLALPRPEVTLPEQQPPISR